MYNKQVYVRLKNKDSTKTTANIFNRIDNELIAIEEK